jgi:hypothetical protein
MSTQTPPAHVEADTDRLCEELVRQVQETTRTSDDGP